jgi:hypothetical protein
VAAVSDVLVLSARLLWSGAFRVGTGLAAAGSDDTIDEAEPLPETSVKNRLRSSAVEAGLPGRLVDEVFGLPGGSGGSWNLLVRQPPVTIGPAYHGRLNDDHAPAPLGLRTEDVARADGPASLHLMPIKLLTPTQLHHHVLTWLVGAAFCKTVGGDRNRGLGAIDIRLQHCSMPHVRGGGLRAQLTAAGIPLCVPAVRAA